MIALPKLYPILDTATLQSRGISPLEAAEALMEAGCQILQFRHKGPFTRSVFFDAQAVSAICRNAGAAYVIDDRADIAGMLGAGVHLGQDDLSPSDARKVLGDTGVVGLSTHNERQMREAAMEPADYVALGPIYATGSKQNPDPVLGPGELKRLRNLTAHPLVAIGGITAENAAEIWTAGADCVAVIGALFPPNCSKAEIRARAESFLV